MIISVDFDGTLCMPNRYPAIHYNFNYLHLARVLNIVQLLGHKVILNTCREDHLLDIALDYCRDVLHLFPDEVNENCPNRIAEFGGDCRKISADIYLDDKGVGYTPDKAMKMLYKIAYPKLYITDDISTYDGVIYYEP